MDRKQDSLCHCDDDVLKAVSGCLEQILKSINEEGETVSMATKVQNLTKQSQCSICIQQDKEEDLRSDCIINSPNMTQNNEEKSESTCNSGYSSSAVAGDCPLPSFLPHEGPRWVQLRDKISIEPEFQKYANRVRDESHWSLDEAFVSFCLDRVEETLAISAQASARQRPAAVIQKTRNTTRRKGQPRKYERALNDTTSTHAEKACYIDTIFLDDPFEDDNDEDVLSMDDNPNDVDYKPVSIIRYKKTPSRRMPRRNSTRSSKDEIMTVSKVMLNDAKDGDNSGKDKKLKPKKSKPKGQNAKALKPKTHQEPSRKRGRPRKHSTDSPRAQGKKGRPRLTEEQRMAKRKAYNDSRTRMRLEVIREALPRLFRCKTCMEQFTGREDMIWHYFEVHRQQPISEQDYQDPTSSYNTCQVIDIATVLRECPDCKEYVENMTYHNRKHQSRNFICEECGKFFVNRIRLKLHMRVHTMDRTGERLHCDKCDKSYRCISSLQRHQLIHAGKKTYICDQCGKDFFNSVRLRVHRAVHMKEKPYKCSECGRGFTQLTNMRSHERVHTGVKPYKCDLCQDSFTHKVSLKMHQKKQHGIDWWKENGKQVRERKPAKKKSTSKKSEDKETRETELAGMKTFVDQHREGVDETVENYEFVNNLIMHGSKTYAQLESKTNVHVTQPFQSIINPFENPWLLADELAATDPNSLLQNEEDVAMTAASGALQEILDTIESQDVFLPSSSPVDDSHPALKTNQGSQESCGLSEEPITLAEQPARDNQGTIDQVGDSNSNICGDEEMSSLLLPHEGLRWTKLRKQVVVLPLFQEYMRRTEDDTFWSIDEAFASFCLDRVEEILSVAKQPEATTQRKKGTRRKGQPKKYERKQATPLDEIPPRSVRKRRRQENGLKLFEDDVEDEDDNEDFLAMDDNPKDLDYQPLPMIRYPKRRRKSLPRSTNSYQAPPKAPIRPKLSIKTTKPPKASPASKKATKQPVKTTKLEPFGPPRKRGRPRKVATETQKKFPKPKVKTDKPTKTYIRMEVRLQRLPKMYECKTCFEQFPEADDVKKHFLGVHQRERLLIPSENGSNENNEGGNPEVRCLEMDNSVLPDLTSLANLLRQCPKCKKYVENMTLHRREHQERKFICEECGKGFTENQILQKHKKVHEMDRTGDRYKCELCEKSYRFHQNLRSHMLYHGGEKTFICDHCGKSFYTNNRLIIHSAIHMKEKPYKCVECGRGFSQKSNMQKHERVHTGVKPYQCELCNESFNHKVSLKNHNKKHHGIDWWKDVGRPKPVTTKKSKETTQAVVNREDQIPIQAESNPVPQQREQPVMENQWKGNEMPLQRDDSVGNQWRDDRQPVREVEPTETIWHRPDNPLSLEHQNQVVEESVRLQTLHPAGNQWKGNNLPLDRQGQAGDQGMAPFFYPSTYLQGYPSGYSAVPVVPINPDTAVHPANRPSYQVQTTNSNCVSGWLYVRRRLMPGAHNQPKKVEILRNKQQCFMMDRHSLIRLELSQSPPVLIKLQQEGVRWQNLRDRIMTSTELKDNPLLTDKEGKSKWSVDEAFMKFLLDRLEKDLEAEKERKMQANPHCCLPQIDTTHPHSKRSLDCSVRRNSTCSLRQSNNNLKAGIVDVDTVEVTRDIPTSGSSQKLGHRHVRTQRHTCNKEANDRMPVSVASCLQKDAHIDVEDDTEDAMTCMPAEQSCRDTDCLLTSQDPQTSEVHQSTSDRLRLHPPRIGKDGQRTENADGSTGLPQDTMSDNSSKSVRDACVQSVKTMTSQDENSAKGTVTIGEDKLKAKRRRGRPRIELDDAEKEAITFNKRLKGIQARDLPRMFSCRSCSQRFQEAEDLRMHTITAHLPISIPDNSDCSVEKHGEICFTHIEIDLGLYQQVSEVDIQELAIELRCCPECNKYVEDFKMHLESHMMKNYICEACGKGFACSKQLKLHSIYHEIDRTGEMQYSCQFCGKKFRSAQSLSIHRPLHNKARNYICQQCGKMFKANTRLQKHMATHAQHKRYSCSFCGRGFAQKCNMTRHQRTHTGEKPYTCNHCNQAFNHNISLKKHLKKEHLIEPEDKTSKEVEAIDNFPSGRLPSKRLNVK
ncbi:uncharacterized protein LOC110981083 [Acanthaster planci]|uniref:Uncharacterized protein LOC110981083 n=1 Tax=Acanthaster planci TaxID=133434 RepID=A0A8B7YL65_ACAPL|nr:uncharacterized protein LOC110981083 [Acanthaster planci]